MVDGRKFGASKRSGFISKPKGKEMRRGEIIAIPKHRLSLKNISAITRRPLSSILLRQGFLSGPLRSSH